VPAQRGPQGRDRVAVALLLLGAEVRPADQKQHTCIKKMDNVKSKIKQIRKEARIEINNK
jgi:hypothetical protein